MRRTRTKNWMDGPRPDPATFLYLYFLMYHDDWHKIRSVIVVPLKRNIKSIRSKQCQKGSRPPKQNVKSLKGHQFVIPKRSCTKNESFEALTLINQFSRPEHHGLHVIPICMHGHCVRFPHYLRWPVWAVEEVHHITICPWFSTLVYGRKKTLWKVSFLVVNPRRLTFAAN